MSSAIHCVSAGVFPEDTDLRNAQALLGDLAVPLSAIPSVPKTPVVGEMARKLRQLSPDRLLVEAHRTHSSALQSARAVHAVKRPDKIESTVRVDPTSIRRIL